MLNSTIEDRNCGCGRSTCSHSSNCNCAQNNSCNYTCNCGTDNTEEEVLPTMELPEREMCPRDCKREEMIMKIKELNFAIVELALYLDTHPDDRKALCLYSNYAKELKDVKDKYQKVYGPLTIYFPCKKWRWLEEPWPWERGNY